MRVSGSEAYSKERAVWTTSFFPFLFQVLPSLPSMALDFPRAVPSRWGFHGGQFDSVFCGFCWAGSLWKWHKHKYWFFLLQGLCRLFGKTHDMSNDPCLAGFLRLQPSASEIQAVHPIQALYHSPLPYQTVFLHRVLFTINPSQLTYPLSLWNSHTITHS